jgi:excisionase family DNA binding protein
MDLGSLISVEDAAQLLAVNRQKVRAFIGQGRLPAVRIGREWRVSVVDLTRFMQTERRPGRPLGASAAWRLLGVGETTGHVQLPRAAPNGDAFWLVNLVRGRASVGRWHALERLLPEIADLLVVGGETAGRDHGFAPRGSSAAIDGYIRASKVEATVGRFALSPAVGAEINVVLRAVDDIVWPFERGVRLVGPLTAAIDMLGEPIDDRSVESARPIVERHL